MNHHLNLKSVAAILAALSLFGCSRYVWDNRLYPATETLFSKHSTECEGAAAQLYPQQLAFVETQPAYKTPYRPAQTHCNAYGNSLSCITTDPGDPGTQMPAKGFSVDTNEKNRSNYWDDCMRGNGWYKEKISTKKHSSQSEATHKEIIQCEEYKCPTGLVCVNNQCSLPATNPRKYSRPSGICTFDSECDVDQKCVGKKCSVENR